MERGDPEADAERQLALRARLREALAQARLVLLRRPVPEEMALDRILVIHLQRPVVAPLDQLPERPEAHRRVEALALGRARAALETVDQLGIELDQKAVDELGAFQALPRLHLCGEPVPGPGAVEERRLGPQAPVERGELLAEHLDPLLLFRVFRRPLAGMADGARQQS